MNVAERYAEFRKTVVIPPETGWESLITKHWERETRTAKFPRRKEGRHRNIERKRRT